jgi:hypothetical protein
MLRGCHGVQHLLSANTTTYSSLPVAWITLLAPVDHVRVLTLSHTYRASSLSGCVGREQPLCRESQGEDSRGCSLSLLVRQLWRSSGMLPRAHTCWRRCRGPHRKRWRLTRGVGPRLAAAGETVGAFVSAGGRCPREPPRPAQSAYMGRRAPRRSQPRPMR